MDISILKIRDTLLVAIDDYFRENGFYEVAPPMLTPFSCEVACVGGSDLISVDYYGKRAYLSQSGQLYLESLVMQLEKVYCIAPAFRAESTLVATHLTEFWMCEAELIDTNLDGLILVASNLLITIIKKVLEKHYSELVARNVDIREFEKIIGDGIPRITYSAAVDVLRNESIAICWGDEIQSHQELVLSKYFNHSPLIITHYPKSLSSFYKLICDKNPKVTLSFDIVAPNGYSELIGASMRETDAVKINNSLKLAGVDSNIYDWYTDMIIANPKEHGGFGLGIERMLAWLCNLKTIKEAIPFPRTEDTLWP